MFAIFESTNFSWERPITIMVSPPVPEILFITSSPKNGLKNPASKTKRAWKIKIENEEKETPIPMLWAIKNATTPSIRALPIKTWQSPVTPASMQPIIPIAPKQKRILAFRKLSEKFEFVSFIYFFSILVDKLSNFLSSPKNSPIIKPITTDIIITKISPFMEDLMPITIMAAAKKFIIEFLRLLENLSPIFDPRKPKRPTKIKLTKTANINPPIRNLK